MRDAPKNTEIFCPVCGKVTIVVRRPKFEGLKKVGEQLNCLVCGTEFPDESQVEFVERAKVTVFSEDDGVRLCLNCQRYVVNPFVQRCMLTMKEIEATDTCKDFVRRRERKEDKEEEKKGADELKKLFGEAEADKTTKEE